MIERLLQGIVPRDVVDTVLADVEVYWDLPIDRIGVDSLAVMSLLARIEEVRGEEIDLDEFTLDQVGTLRRVVELAGGATRAS